MYGVKNYADRRDVHNSRNYNFLLDIRVSCHLKLFMPTMKVLKDCGILKYIERRTGRIRIRPVNLFDRTSTESGFFSVRCTPKVSTFRTWLLFRNSPYKCHLVYATGEISLYLRNKSPDFLCYACTMNTDIFTVTKNWFSQHDIWSSDQRIASSVWVGYIVQQILCLDPIIISSVLGTFRLSLLAFSQQLRLFNSGVRASLSSVNVLADNVRLVSSANILGTGPRRELGRPLI